MMGGDHARGLAGLRVLDLTANVAGPWATQILADLGSDVIKVERPGSGDDTRSWGPPFWDENPDLSITFGALNRGKRSLAIDLSDPAGREKLDSFIRHADVLIQNMRSGAFAGLGYTAERLKELNPQLVYCEITGYGHRGPLADRPAFDPLMQAFSGIMSITGEAGSSPVRVPVSVLDKTTGLWAAIAIQNALMARARTGEGAHVQLSLLETALNWLPFVALNYLADGNPPKRLGSQTPGVAPYQAFETADGHMIVAAGNQRLWERLCDALDRPDLIADERFADNSLRSFNRGSLADALQDEFSERSTDEWVAILGEHGVPVTPIQTVDQVLVHPQVVELDVVQRIDHPASDTYYRVRSPITVDGEPVVSDRLPPTLGADNDELRDGNDWGPSHEAAGKGLEG